MSHQFALPTADNARLRPEIDRIISGGQQADVSTCSAKPVAAATLFTGILLWVSFTPVDFAPAAWIALSPLCLLLRVSKLPRLSYRAITLCGFVWAVATLQWMRLGHVAMYGGLVALAFYVSLYFPVFVALARSVVRAGCPVWLAVPLVWTSLEFLRAYLMTGFSWYYLGHTQYQWISLVQIADVTGTYGISFLVAMASGVLAECIPANTITKLGLAESPNSVSTLCLSRRLMAAGFSVTLVVLSCVYGAAAAVPTDDEADGPVVAVVQGNFAPEVKHDKDQRMRLVREHDLLSRRAAGMRPDLIVWPETMFPVPLQIIGEGVTDDDLLNHFPAEAVLNREQMKMETERWHSDYAQELITSRSQEAGAAMLIGLITEFAEKTTRKIYNSAAFVRPDLGYVGRYDKQHRVIFGEYIPLRSTLPWLAKLTPFGANYGIDAGSSPRSFEYAGTRFSPIICFEDTVPQLVRQTVNAKDENGNRPDVLINMTNDGWFRGSSELDQHLITATFRCIETRRPMIRAVNAGISAFIDSSGRIRQPEHFIVMKEDSAGVIADFETADSTIDPATGKRYRQCSAVMCGQIPLDGRDTIYLQFGDWFAILCSLAATTFVVLGKMQTRHGQDIPAPVT